jgi:hypothetical protein
MLDTVFQLILILILDTTSTERMTHIMSYHKKENLTLNVL